MIEYSPTSLRRFGRQSLGRPIGLGLLMFALFVATLPTAAGTTAAGPTAAGSASSRAGVSGLGRPQRLITLITGERGVLGDDGRGHSTFRIIPGAGSVPGPALATATLGAHHYVFPATARRYLGTYLDPSLFDVDRLAVADFSGRLPVRINYAGAAPPSIPGISVTAAGHGSAVGYLTPGSAKSFGAALARQAVADSAASRPAAPGLFGSVTSIRPDIAPAASAPKFPQVTVAIKATGRNGQPLKLGLAMVVNADDARRATRFVPIIHGRARASLPTGHYMVVVVEDIFESDDRFTSYIDVITDQLVRKNLQILALDTRRATAEQPTVGMTRPTSIQGLEVDLYLTGDRSGYYAAIGLPATPPQSRVLFRPMRRPVVGRLREVTTVSAVDPSFPGGRFTYDGAWVEDGISAGQHHDVPSSGLSRTDSTYATDGEARLGGSVRFVFVPGQEFAFSGTYPTPMPLTRREYTFGPTGYLFDRAQAADLFGTEILSEEARAPVPNEIRSTNWFRQPFITGVSDHSPANTGSFCPACRSKTSMTLDGDVMDKDPQHVEYIFSPSDDAALYHFKIFKDGTLLDQGEGLGGVFDVPTTPATYRVLLDADRSSVFTLSTQVASDITFVSDGVRGRPLPGGIGCASGKSCRALPVLRAQLDLHASAGGEVPTGETNFDLDVRHFNLAEPATITSASVQVRRNGTTAWATLPVSRLGPGRYTASFAATAAQAGQVWDLRVSATDAVGGVLHQTTTRAFRVAG
jgi:hypothetical protein